MTANQRLADLQAVAETLDRHAENQAAIQAEAEWSVNRDPAELAGFELAARLATLEQTSPGFAQARQILNRGFWLVALDGAGRPRSDFGPSRDEAAAALFWAEHPQAQAGVACGTEESDLYALELGNPGGQGHAWLKAVALDPPPADYRPDPEEPYVGPEGWMRDPCGVTIRLQELEPLTGPRRRHIVQAPPMTERARKEQALAMVRPLQPPQRLICVWEWPADGEWRLRKPGTRVADQVTVLGAIPSEGSVLEVGGKRWRVANGLPRLLAMPPWLAEAVGGKCVGSNGKTARWVDTITGLAGRQGTGWPTTR